jgi:hypothetical protein
MSLLILEPVDVPMSWGGETWLNSTWPGKAAAVKGLDATFRQWLRRNPSALGSWSRALFGNDLPFFTKVLRTRFPPLVHLGFSRTVEARTFLAWLNREQDLLRRFFDALCPSGPESFRRFQDAYEDWAVVQSLKKWRLTETDGHRRLVRSFAPFLRDPSDPRVSGILAQLRDNRARIVSVLNEINLSREHGRLLLSPAGTVHSIFGLSLQVHPSDPALGRLRTILRDGAQTPDRTKAVRRLSLSRGRPTVSTAGPRPKSEAWMPMELNGRTVLVETQQTSDTTYSLADFYTPFVWRNGMAFRKGDRRLGIRSKRFHDISKHIDFQRSLISSARLTPQRVETIPRAVGVRSTRLVDHPLTWPFFTTYKLTFQGTPRRPASWNLHAEPDRFQSLVVIRGRAEIQGAGAAFRLPRWSAVFVPASRETYALRSSGETEVLVFRLPRPQSRRPTKPHIKAGPLPLPSHERR